MKVVAFNGSPRKRGNTYISLNKVLDTIEADGGFTTELINLSEKNYRGCTACYKCFDAKDGKCHGPKDDINELIEKFMEADGVLVGSPTYFAAVSTEVKAFMDRVGIVGIANDRMYKHKVGAAVVAVRRAGATEVFSQINKLFMINNMIVPGSCYWNLTVGREPGDVLNDREGMQTMLELGQNMAWLLKKIHQ